MNTFPSIRNIMFSLLPCNTALMAITCSKRKKLKAFVLVRKK